MATEEQNKCTSYYCEPCGKKISSEAAYQNHMSSAKHKMKVAKHEERGTPNKPTGSSEKKSLMENAESSTTSGTMDTGQFLVGVILYAFVYNKNRKYTGNDFRSLKSFWSHQNSFVS